MNRIPNPIRKFGPAALLLLLLVIFQWHLIIAWPPLLRYLLSLVVVMLGVYSLLRSRVVIPLDKSLQDTYFERFRRLEGLYKAVAYTARNDPSTRGVALEFESQTAKLESLVDGENNRFKNQDAQNDVHNLHLVFLQITPVDYLSLDIQTLESDYRQTAGAVAYEAYLGALLRNKPADASVTAEEHARRLRADATFLVNETRRQDLLKQHVEHTRQRLLRSAFRSWWWNVTPLVAILVAFLACESWIGLAKTRSEQSTAAPGTAAAATSDSESWKVSFVTDYLLEPRPQGSERTHSYGETKLYQIIIMATLLALAGIAGASGGMMSVVQRIQSNTPESDAGIDLRVLSLAETAVFFAPITGLIFALVLSLIFASKAINGTLFPTIPTDGYWYHTLWDAPETAKWMLWAFVAGFSERLVPDLLNTLTRQTSASEKKSPSTGNQLPPPPGNKEKERNPATVVAAGENGTDTEEKENNATPATSSALVLDPHPDTIPPDATALTITGKNFNPDTQVYVNDQPKTVKDRTATSLSVDLVESDLRGQEIHVVATAGNGENAGRTNPLVIPIGDPGE